MTEVERQTLENARAACLASAEANRVAAEALAAVLSGDLVVTNLKSAGSVAKDLGRSPRTVHRWVRDYGIGRTINGRVFVDLSKLADFIREEARRNRIDGSSEQQRTCR